MTFTVFYFFLILLSSLISSGYAFFGYGVDRLKQSNRLKGESKRRSFGHRYHLTDSVEGTDCGPVKSFVYHGGVIDNFASKDDQFPWEGGQRYWVNEELWGGPGYPIFAFVGGEWTESCSSLLNGSMYIYDLATQHRGLLVDVEHRFYGDSFPINNTELDSLEYLTSDQALADLARVLEEIKSTYKTSNSSVITIGGSYSGNLVAWFRLKYPSSTLASIASSGPLTAELNFDEYMLVVKNSIDYYSGPDCNRAFQDAAEYTYNLVLQGPNSSGYAALSSNFSTCDPLETVKDATILLSNLMGLVQGVVQYNSPNEQNNGIKGICSVMLTGADTPLQHYQNFMLLNAEMTNYTCQDVKYANTVAYLSDTSKAAATGSRQWTYQTCNQFGYYQTTDNADQPFYSWKLLDLTFYYDLCYDAFDGWNYDPETEWTNDNYGDTRIGATNIIFPTGTIDPWHVLGVVNTTVLPQSTEESLLIVGTSHCADLHAPSPNDIPAMTAARANISAFVSYTLAGSPDTPEPISSDTCDDNSSTVTALAAALGVTSGGLCIMLFLHFSRKKSDNHTAQVGLLSDSRMPNRV